jgi:hypothetical protein
MGIEGYTPSPEEMKKAEDMMSDQEKGLSKVRERDFERLGTGIDRDYLFNLHAPDNGVYDALEGVLYGHTVEATEKLDGTFVGYVDGVQIENPEDVKKIFDKWSIKARNKQAEDAGIAFTRHDRALNKRDIGLKKILGE